MNKLRQIIENHNHVVFESDEETEQAIIDLFTEIVRLEVQPCEPDCSPERHAYHEGQWDMGQRLEQMFLALSNKEAKDEPVR